MNNKKLFIGIAITMFLVYLALFVMCVTKIIWIQGFVFVIFTIMTIVVELLNYYVYIKTKNNSPTVISNNSLKEKKKGGMFQDVGNKIQKIGTVLFFIVEAILALIGLFVPIYFTVTYDFNSMYLLISLACIIAAFFHLLWKIVHNWICKNSRCM